MSACEDGAFPAGKSNDQINFSRTKIQANAFVLKFYINIGVRNFWLLLQGTGILKVSFFLRPFFVMTPYRG